MIDFVGGARAPQELPVDLLGQVSGGQGSSIDPNGSTRNVSIGSDPNGSKNDAGSRMDPDG
jgi:hypothetical protein